MARRRLFRGAFLGFALALALPAQALAIQVTTTDDGTDLAGQCTLREAVTAANGGIDPYRDCVGGTDGPDTINIPASASRYIVGALGTSNEDANAGRDLDVTSDITFDGGGAANTLIDGGGADRVFHIIGPRTVELRDLTVTGGKAPNGASVLLGVPGNPGQNGGGILNGGDLTLTRVVVDGNESGRGSAGGPGGLGVDGNPGTDSTGAIGGDGGKGGGIYSTGNSLTLFDSTVSNNFAGNGGLGGNGAPAGDGTGTTGAAGGDSTGGTGGPGGSGGGIYSQGGTLTLTLAVVEDNTGGAGGRGGAGGFGGNGGQGTAGPGGTGGDSLGGGGGSGSFGGGIRLDTASLAMGDSVVRNNTSGAGGAGGDTSDAGNGGTDSSGGGVGGNTHGGAGHIGGQDGGISGSDSNEIVTGSTISGNSAGFGGSGGAGSTGGDGGGGIGPGGDSVGGDGGSGGFTGGVGHAGSATASYTNVTIAGNHSGAGGDAGDGGAPGASTTLPGQQAGGTGGNGGAPGGVLANANFNLDHVTIASNDNGGPGLGGGPGGSAGSAGGVGGLFVGGGTTALRSTIVANNDPDQCGGTFFAANNNLEFPADPSCPASTTGNPVLGALQDNGGPTFTMQLGAGSAALDAATAFCAGGDQREVTRPKGPNCDLGAVEMSPPGATTGAASEVTQTGAKLTGTVNTGQLPTTSKFQFGKSTAYGSEASASGSSPTATLAGLEPNTTYHYRLTATNPDGSSSGADLTFKTGATPAGGGGSGGSGGGTLASFRGLRFLLSSVGVDSKRRAWIKVSCPADSDGNCAGTLSLSARLTFVTTSQASRTRKRKRTVKFGKKKFSIAKGKSTRVRIKVSKRAFGILRTRKKVKATLVAVTHDARNKNKTTKRNIALRAPKAKRKPRR